MAEETATAPDPTAVAENTADAVEPAGPTDAVRERMVEVLSGVLGSALIESHIAPGSDLWVRVDRAAWTETFVAVRDKLGCAWLDFVSAIDWLPSPFGRDMEAEQDWIVHGRDAKDLPPMVTGVAGGDTRFQIFGRLYNIKDNVGVTVKADLPDDDLSVDTLIPVFAGVNWHEREAWEMFGIHFNGHPDLRALYLPSAFEGHPMRKDFPLLSRRVKPWPGIVDVEPMPGSDDEPEESGDDS